MVSINKFTNLNRLDINNILIVFGYFFKRTIKIRPNLRQRSVYNLYTILIQLDGFLFEETKNYYVVDLKNNFKNRIKLRKNPSSDFEIFNQIFISQEYLPVINAYKNNFGSNKGLEINIIDAGSNIGLTSLFFLEHFNNPNIICVEPEIENFNVLEFNLNGNRKSKIIKINGAIWSSNCKIKIVNDFRDKSNSSFRVEETNSMDSISAYSVNHLVAANNFETLDILKIDIEGSEKQLFTSPKSNLDFLKITKCIAIEIHDEFNCRKEIYSILDVYGFTLFDEGELTIGINQNLK